LVAEIAGAETAQAIQLQIEYAPTPPFGAGSPETAPPAILARLREQNARPRGSGEKLSKQRPRGSQHARYERTAWCWN
jgi:cyclohexyl-isocyanide hydratase